MYEPEWTMTLHPQRGIIAKVNGTWRFTAGKWKGREVIQEGTRVPSTIDYWLWAVRAGAIPADTVKTSPELTAWNKYCRANQRFKPPYPGYNRITRRKRNRGEEHTEWDEAVDGYGDPTEAGMHLGGYGWDD